MPNNTNLPGVKNTPEQPTKPAGCFSSWLRRTRYGLIKDAEVDVHCGDCNVCCRSSYFIHIRPDETQTLANIPKPLLFAAPGLPKGHKVMGYDENGRCPMLVDNKCSIYKHRSLTCRIYDCRIFAAAGIEAGDEDKAQITQRVKQWEFAYPTQRDREQHAAVKAAAKFLQERTDCFPDGSVPRNPSQLAILAIKVYDVFLKIINESGKTGPVSSNMEIAKAVIESNEKFEARRDVKNSKMDKKKKRFKPQMSQINTD